MCDSMPIFAYARLNNMRKNKNIIKKYNRLCLYESILLFYITISYLSDLIFFQNETLSRLSVCQKNWFQFGNLNSIWEPKIGKKISPEKCLIVGKYFIHHD